MEALSGIIPGHISCGAGSVSGITTSRSTAGVWFFLSQLLDIDETYDILAE
jgi:hypothetical protein